MSTRPIKSKSFVADGRPKSFRLEAKIQLALLDLMIALGGVTATAADGRKCRAEYRNVGSTADVLTEHIGLGPAALIRFGKWNHRSLPQGTAKLVMLTLQTQQGFVTGRMFIEKTHVGVGSRGFTPGCG